MAIAILLSTYNGELFLQEQLDSIISQTYSNWILYIRDDGSTDNTIEIINRYVKEYPIKIKLISDKLGNLRSDKSFMQILSVVESEYYMFSDQDDKWLPNKIEITLSKIKDLEAENINIGALVFTDLLIVDSKLKIINPSMWNYSNINPENAKDFYITACLSSVTGCTIMFNQKLKEKILPYPKSSRMHDWWISLNAIHYGLVDYISSPTLYYRQHDNNVLGAEYKSKYQYFKKLILFKSLIKDNISQYKMLKSLSFKINFIKFYFMKIKIILNITK